MNFDKTHTVITNKVMLDEVLSNTKKFIANLLKNNYINNENGFDIHIEVLQGGVRYLNIVPKPIKFKRE